MQVLRGLYLTPKRVLRIGLNRCPFTYLGRRRQNDAPACCDRAFVTTTRVNTASDLTRSKIQPTLDHPTTEEWQNHLWSSN